MQQLRIVTAHPIDDLGDLVKRYGTRAAKVIEPQDANVHEAQDRLQRRLGLKVRIEDRKGKGRVIIEYADVDDFDSILNALGQ